MNRKTIFTALIISGASLVLSLPALLLPEERVSNVLVTSKMQYLQTLLCLITIILVGVLFFGTRLNQRRYYKKHNLSRVELPPEEFKKGNSYFTHSLLLALVFNTSLLLLTYLIISL